MRMEILFNSSGEDGMNYIKIVNQTCELLSHSYEKLTESHVFEIKENFSYLTKAVVDAIKKDKKFVKTRKTSTQNSLINIIS